ncbi:uncharacterized protein V2V93DRAFT_372420 [Kockiozyma suomiensis]|uniref:uncharacterized protein n=1 Tax=Kockiozyma suomiensis TaxID=1337062 RepID=UPI003343D1B0
MASTYATGLEPLPTKVPDTVSKHILELFSLKGKVASITGSSSGIGLEIARGFASVGADVAIWYHGNPSAIEKAKKISEEFGVRCKAYKCAIDNSKEVEATINQIYEDFGGLDVQIANAGVPWTEGPLIDPENDDHWNKIVNTDFNGAYYTAKYTGRIFKKQGHGSLVFTASMSGHIVNIPQMQACYNAAKAGLLHLSRSLAVEWAGFARVNTVSPGYMLTEISDFIPHETKEKWWKLIPFGREGDPRELVGAYLYFASDASTYTSGADLIVDGAYCAP